MNYKKLFWISFWFYIGAIFVTRFAEAPFDFFSKVFYGLPLEFIDGRRSVKIQTCSLKSSQIADFLKRNSDQCPSEGKGEYLVLRYRDLSGGKFFGVLKCYFSCFPYPLLIKIPTTPWRSMKSYYNVILPYPYTRSDKPCKVNTRWKYFWGGK